MAESGRLDPFDGMISLVASPIAAGIRSFEQLRKGSDELLRGVENFNTTMENLNDTIARVNRILNEFEEPLKAIMPQITRTVKMAEDLSNRLAGPVDQVAPGLSRLADTLNSPMMTSIPTDLGEFMAVINELGRRMTPLAQLAEQAGGMFGLRLPGFPGRGAGSAPATTPAAATTAVPAAEPAAASASPSSSRSTPPRRTGTAAKASSPAPAKRATKKRAAKKTTSKRSPAKKSAAKKATTR